MKEVEEEEMVMLLSQIDHNVLHNGSTEFVYALRKCM